MQTLERPKETLSLEQIADLMDLPLEVVEEDPGFYLGFLSNPQATQGYQEDF